MAQCKKTVEAGGRLHSEISLHDDDDDDDDAHTHAALASELPFTASWGGGARHIPSRPDCRPRDEPAPRAAAHRRGTFLAVGFFFFFLVCQTNQHTLGTRHGPGNAPEKLCQGVHGEGCQQPMDVLLVRRPNRSVSGICPSHFQSDDTSVNSPAGGGTRGGRWTRAVGPSAQGQRQAPCFDLHEPGLCHPVL